MTQQTCKNCGHQFTGKYCSNCGEKIYTDKDRSVGHVFSEGIHFITHLEGTLFSTLKTIFTRPGKLSLDYCEGIRKKYFKPLSFFLLLVILYLLFPVFEGLNMKLQYHEVHGVYGKYAKQVVSKILVQRNISEAQLADSFHHAGEKTSKFLLFIIIPAVAFASWLLGMKKRKYYFDHFIFTTEMSSFFLLWGFLLLPLVVLLLRLISPRLAWSEGITTIFILVPYLIYISLAAKRFFNFSWWYTILYAVLFSISLIIFLEYIYKFILFLIAIRMA